MKQINITIEEKLKNIFPNYLNEDLFPEPENVRDPMPVPNHNYDTFAVSVYDHFLTEDEDWYHPTYSWLPKDIRGNLNEKRWIAYIEDEHKFIHFYNELYKRGIYVLSPANHFLEFCDINEFEKSSIQDIRELNSQTYAVPSLGLLITGNFEFTHIVHASKEHYKKDEFEKIVRDSGLYILKR